MSGKVQMGPDAETGAYTNSIKTRAGGKGLVKCIGGVQARGSREGAECPRARRNIAHGFAPYRETHRGIWLILMGLLYAEVFCEVPIEC